MRILDQFEPIENEDYLMLNVEHQIKPGRGGGVKHAKEYTLHPRLFKLCLMRNKNTLKYSKYYLLLEECIKYYNDYKNNKEHINGN